jgi:lysophospholipase L1-like esterase
MQEKLQTKIYLTGDSTMADKKEEKFPETGWGQVLSNFFTPDVAIINYAKNGQSTKSFIDEGHWQAVYNRLSTGDYVFIQFGHNDEKLLDPNRYTIPETTYKQNLIFFITQSRNKGAIPVLLTPVVRRKFDGDGSLIDTHSGYHEVVRSVASEYHVILIDHEKLSRDMITSMGDEKSKNLFLWLQPGESINYPDGNSDNTHFNRDGAIVMAKLVVQEIQRQKIGIHEYLTTAPKNEK